MSATILDTIVAQKKLEIIALYQQHQIQVLRRTVQPTAKSLYSGLADYRARSQPFFIFEFKRKSPSESWINRDIAIAPQLEHYQKLGAAAVSVLTDEAFFGGSYEDLRKAGAVLGPTDTLLLQKDFVLDPIQILLARLAGADMILLIAAILSPEKLAELQAEAESLGMGVLVEVHDQEEFDRIRHLPFPVLGINNRDLKNFRTALNRVNVISAEAGERFIISESGIKDERDLKVARKADGFLIGTSLMRGKTLQPTFDRTGLLFKACGIREPAHLELEADYLGINFSPRSKRKPSAELLEHLTTSTPATDEIWSKLVPVFYQNTERKIRQILTRFPFQFVQLYAGDVSPAFVRTLKQKVLLACRIQQSSDLNVLKDYASDIDFFILDGATPGSGARISTPIPSNFPYPFLLAGGIQESNLKLAANHKNCIGVDVASGIETTGLVDAEKVARLSAAAKGLALKSG
ncbi:MAG: hypothetical protein IPL65_08370 [Lewinellaceae bacterium]|nr:hypothetical protein [Lewinellaceae bacterium]